MSSTPSLQQAWFNLEASGDLRFALLFEDQVGVSDPSKLFEIDEPELEAELDDSPESIGWYENYATESSMTELLEENDDLSEAFEARANELATESSDTATEAASETLDLVGESPPTLSVIDDNPRKVITGTIDAYFDSSDAEQTLGEGESSPLQFTRIRFKQDFASGEDVPAQESVHLQTSHGFIYQLPSRTNLSRLENYEQYARSHAGNDDGPLQPGDWNEKVLVPEISHRPTPMLQLLRSNAGRRRLLLSEVARTANGITTTDELVANNGPFDLETALGMTGPNTREIPFVYAAAPLAAAGALVGGPAGAFAGIATAELLATVVSLGYAADSAEDIFDDDDISFLSAEEVVKEVLTTSATYEVDGNYDLPVGPTLDTTIGLADFQFRHSVRKLALAEPSELESAIDEHRELLEIQRKIVTDGWDIESPPRYDDTGEYPKTWLGYDGYVQDHLSANVIRPRFREKLGGLFGGVDEAIASEMEMLDQFEAAALGSSSDGTEEGDDVEEGVLFEDSFEDGLDAYGETEGEVAVTDEYAVDGERSLHCSRPTDSRPPITWLKTRETFSGPMEIAYRIRFSTDNRYAGAHFDFGEYRVKHSYQAQQIGVHRAENGEPESGEGRSFEKLADTPCEFGSGEWYAGTITVADSEITVERGDCRVSAEVADDALETTGPLTVRAYVPDPGDDVYVDELSVRRPK